MACMSWTSQVPQPTCYRNSWQLGNLTSRGRAGHAGDRPQSRAEHSLHVGDVALAVQGRFTKELDLTCLRVQLHVIERSPLELVELLLLKSALSRGCPVHVRVRQVVHIHCLSCTESALNGISR